MSPGPLTLIQGLILGAVSYRAWRFAGVDDITSRARARLPGGGQHFLECSWCAGFWITVVATLAVHLLWSLENPWLVGGVAAVVVGALGERL